MKNLIIVFFISNLSFAQRNFTQKDSLRGGLKAERTCFDVQRYDLLLTVNIAEKAISGQNDITFKVVSETKKIQIDLFENMSVDSILLDSKKLIYDRKFDAVFVNFDSFLAVNSLQKIKVYYHGKPQIAKNAPWDGGFIFKNSQSGLPFVAVACQGDGASLWFPCKDSQSDEPDLGASIKTAVPNGLTCVSNGRLTGFEDLKNGYTRWDWEVKNPINNYDITLNIGDYANFNDNYKGLDLSYYVLKENLQKAKTQFDQVKPMMDCFQSKFGEYPFKNDGYKLVETPYLGMEHQSCVAYGNGFQNGYLGSDLSDTGVGMNFDYILVHESGHEWFGNSITSQDVADMWVHEGFTCYTEAVYVECTNGYDASQTYINGLKNNIRNDKPITGQYGVSNEGSGDMYFKGALMLNTIRHILDNDDLWWKVLKNYSETFRHKIITAKILIDFFNSNTNLNLTPIFNQFLNHKNIPVLELKKIKNNTFYRWKTDVNNFKMPFEVAVKSQNIKYIATNNWKKLNFKVQNLSDLKINFSKFLFDVQIL